MAEIVNNTFDFDTGLKTFVVNNNPDCTITFNPADALFVEKISIAANNIARITEAMDNEEKGNVEPIQHIEKACRNELNKIFEYDICTSIFHNVSITALGSNGYPVAYNFLIALKEQCESYVSQRAEKLKENTKKYTSGYVDDEPDGSHDENIQPTPKS